jgi:hypothetical protein
MVQRQANQLEAQARQLERRVRQRVLETVPSKQHFLNWLRIPAPLLDLVEVARLSTRRSRIAQPIVIPRVVWRPQADALPQISRLEKFQKIRGLSSKSGMAILDPFWNLGQVILWAATRKREYVDADYSGLCDASFGLAVFNASILRKIARQRHDGEAEALAHLEALRGSNGRPTSPIASPMIAR